MHKFGINVPEGLPASSVQEVKRAAELMQDEKGEVRGWCTHSMVLRRCARALCAQRSLYATMQNGLFQTPGSAGAAAGRASGAVSLSQWQPYPAAVSLSVQVVLKAQILAGGRGLGKFTSGLQGGVHICKAAEAPELAKKVRAAKEVRPFTP